MPILGILKEKIEYVASYVQGSCTDWFLVKKEIVRSMPGHLRTNIGFSVRHRNTKKMLINDFDKEVISYWKLLTGIELFIDPARLHDLAWVHRPKGWALNGNKEKYLQAANEGKKDGNP